MASAVINSTVINTPAAVAALVTRAGIVDDGGIAAVFLNHRSCALSMAKLEKRPDGTLVDLVEPIREGLRVGAAGFVLVCDTRVTAEAASASIAALRRLSLEYDLHLVAIIDISDAVFVTSDGHVFRAALGPPHFERTP